MDTIQIKKRPLIFPLEKTLLLSLGEINTAFALFESDYINYQLNRELNPYAYKKRANQSSVSQIQLRIKNMERQKQLEKKTLLIAKNELNRSEILFKKGTIAKQEYENQEAKYISQERNFENMDVSISQLKQNLNEALNNSKENTISNKMETTLLYKNAVQSFHTLNGAIKDWERKYVLKSDVSGTISYMSHFYKNQQVQQGELLFSVIPSESGNFIAKIKAPIQNSGKIKLGQKVHIKLLNYPETEYGVLNGDISSMSPIPDNDGFYIVNVNLKRELITSYNISIPFKTEMSGTAEIVTEDLRLLERLFYQLRNVFN
jgi:multidrug resistance efflux pump